VSEATFSELRQGACSHAQAGLPAQVQKLQAIWPAREDQVAQEEAGCSDSLARFRVPNPSRTPLLKTAQSSFKAGRFYNVLQTDMAQEFKRKKRALVEGSTVKIRSHLNSASV